MVECFTVYTVIYIAERLSREAMSVNTNFVVVSLTWPEIEPESDNNSLKRTMHWLCYFQYPLQLMCNIVEMFLRNCCVAW